MNIFLHNSFSSAPHIVVMNMLADMGMAGYITSHFEILARKPKQNVQSGD
jgi:hypothetical protein